MTIANVNIKKVLFRRGNTIQNDNYVGVFGEVSVDTQANTLRVHNGVTAGGTRLATYAELTDLAVGNIDLTGYTTTAQITAANTEIAKLRANITAANAAIVSNYNFLLSNAGVAHTEINGLRADITAANVAWTANAATQATAINSINANLGSFQTYANATFTGGGGGSNYSNTNVAAYLTGSITAGNIIPTTNAVFTLGNTTHWWKELYVGSNTIYIGGIPLSIDPNQNLLIDGNIVQGNVDAVNSNVSVIDANIGAYQRWANINAAVQTTSINTTSANIGAYQIYANANAAAQTIAINTINANVAAANAAITAVTAAWTANAGTQATDINALRANITAANSAIDAVTTAWTANAGTQATEINSLRANVTAANTAIATLQTQVYSNVNTAAYLTGAITTGNITAANVIVENNAVILGNLRVAGTQTTVNASTLNITDLWVTVADGATQASDAHGAGLRVDGALANIAYSSVSDSFEFNKQIVVGNVKFSDTTRLSGNTITLPNTQGFNWYFNDPMIGSDTVTLYMNGLTTGYDSWALTTGNGTNSWMLDSSTQEFSLFNGGVDGGKLVFGTAANAGVRSSIDDIELKSSVGNVFIRANANPWTFSENGNLILPTRMNFISSPAISGTGIIFGDGSYQNTAWTGNVARLTNNGYNVTLGTDGTLTIVNAITTPGGQYFVVTSDTSTEMSWANAVQDPNTDVYSGIGSNSDGTAISVASTDSEGSWVFKTWDFDMSGNLTIPGNINYANGQSILSGITGGGGSTGDLIISGNIITSNDGNTFVNFDSDNELVLGTNTSSNVKIFVDDSNGGNLKTWTFSTDGSLIVPKFGTINFVDPVIGGFGTPNTTTRTPGNRIVLYPSFNGSGLVDYAIGIDGDVQWYSIPDSNARFEWYAGNNKVLSLSGDGILQLPAGGDIVDSTGTSVLGGGGGNVSLPGLATSGTGTSNVAGNQVYALSINTESESDDEIQLKVYAGGNNAGPAISIGQDNGGSHRANVIAIGNYDVGYNSLPGGVYIGYAAGYNNAEQPQGLHSIAIGSKAAYTFATNNSITLNATGNDLTPDESGLFIKPVRAEEYDDAILYYNPTSGEVTYANNTGGGATVSNTAPTAVNGRLWYNTDDGRMYVRGLDTWIDASPAVVPGNMVGYDVDGNITLRDDASINYANGVSIINSVYGDSQVANFLDDYTGNIAKIGSAPLNITAASVRLNSDNETWSFDNDGVMTFPDGTRQNTAAADLGNFAGNIVKPGAGDGYEFSANVAGIDAGAGAVYVELDQELFGGPTEGLITIAGVTGMTEANGTWGYQAVEARFIQLYTTYPVTTSLTGTGWGTYTSGGTAVSLAANPLTISADSITLRTVNNNNYLFDNYGITFPDDTVQTTAYTGGGGNVDLSNYTSGNVYINRENTGLIVDAANDKRVGFMKYFGIESSFVHANGPTKSVPFRIGRVAADDITLANNSVFTTEIFISNIGQVGINTTTPAYDLDVGGNVGVSGSLLIGANTTISNDGAEFRLWATDTDITVYRNGQDGYGVKSGNIEVYTDNGLRTLTNSNGFELKTGNIIIPNDKGVVFANGVNILSTVDVYGNTQVASYLLNFDGDIEFTSSTAIIANVDVITVLDHVQSPVYQFTNGSEITGTSNSITLQVPNSIPTGVANWEGQGGWNQSFYGDLATTGGTGTGLTVDVAAGGGGYINIEAISINNPGSGYTNGDVITIVNEYNLASTFTLIVPTQNWNFGANGATTFPSNLIIQSNPINPGTVISQANALISIATTGTAATYIGWSEFEYEPGNIALVAFNETAGGLVTIQTGATTGPEAFNEWIFDADGSTTFPDAGAVSITGNLAAGNVTTTGLRVLNTYAPVAATGNVGDLHGQIRIDSNYLYVTSGAYGQQSYTVKAFADHVFGTQYFIALAKGTYPKPENGWEITRDGWGMYFSLDAEPVDFGTYWWCSLAGFGGTFPAWSAGDNVTLRGTTSTVWKSIPLSTIRTPAYSNSNVEAYIGGNIGAFQIYANANAASQQTSIDTLLGRVDQSVNTTSSPQFAGLTATANVEMTANVRIHQNLIVDGNINFVGNVTQNNVTTANAVFTGDTYGFSALYAGVIGYTPLPYTVIQATADYDDYSQINFQNLNLSANASTEWVATAGNGTDLTNYIDFGIAGGAWNGTQLNSVGTAAKANDGWVYVLGNTAAGTGGNLVLGTIQPGKQVNILTGGPNSANIYSYFNSSGLITANVYAANYLFANGVNILSTITADSTYSNANVVANLQNFVTAISTTANITTTANVIAPNYLFANGVNILSTVSAGSSYANADAAAYLAANSAIYLGNPVTRYPLQANVTQTFIGNTTTIGAGSNHLGGTYILNNAYFGANGAMYARNTQTGAAQFRVSGGSFDWAGTTGAVTANTVQSFALWAGLNSSTFTTYNSIGITSAGLITASAGLSITSAVGITTTQTTFPLVNATATTVQFGGAATTITAGATTVNVQVGGSSMRGNVSAGNILVGGNISVGNILVSSNISAISATLSGNITVANIITTGTYGNITGANVISANSVSVTTFVRTAAVTFATLPDAAAAGAGARAFITDGNTATFGSQVSGGGANAVPVYSNGTNWYVG